MLMFWGNIRCFGVSVLVLHLLFLKVMNLVKASLTFNYRDKLNKRMG